MIECTSHFGVGRHVSGCGYLTKKKGSLKNATLTTYPTTYTYYIHVPSGTAEYYLLIFLSHFWGRDSHLIWIRPESPCASGAAVAWYIFCCCGLPSSWWNPDQSPGWPQCCLLQVLWCQLAHWGGVGGPLLIPENTDAIQQGWDLSGSFHIYRNKHFGRV